MVVSVVVTCLFLIALWHNHEARHASERRERPITKELFILWFQGFESAPDIVRRCLRSWYFHNPDWNINVIDESNLGRFLRLEDYVHMANKNIERCHVADIIRCILLFKYGGVWVDATTFCNKPLSVWLPEHAREGFFAFENGPISNWFLYAEPGNYIMRQWLRATLMYYRTHDRAHTYFVHHELFGGLCDVDSRFRAMWEKVPSVSANGLGPHYLQEKGLFAPLSGNVKRDIDSKITPLYKLTHKLDSEFDPRHNVQYLYSTIQHPTRAAEHQAL
jgi:hypothetical protein